MHILSSKEQYKIIDSITKDRLCHLIPKLMEETGIDMWLMLSAEYNEDPVFKTIVPAVMNHASRLTCLVFSLDKGKNYEAVSINKPNKYLAAFYKQLPCSSGDQWDELKKYIVSKNPEKIGVNIDIENGLTAGLSHGLYNKFTESLGSQLSEKIVSARKLCIRWLEQRTCKELSLYPALYQITAIIMAQAFSREVITPGIITTEDVVFWASEQFARLGLPLCFPLTVNLQRKGQHNSMITGTICPGDLLHYDAGIQYLGLCSDMQRLAYVLDTGETQAPQSIVRGFSKGLELGKIIAQEFIEGRTGNQIFSNVIRKAEEKDYEAMIYTYPIGNYCHGAGPIIGLYDKQDFIPVRGENKLHRNTAFALEYNIAHHVKDWDGQKVYFYLEETVTFTENGKINFLDNHYNQLILI